jgi:hypothetical protein
MENAYYMLAGKPERKEKKMTVLGYCAIQIVEVVQRFRCAYCFHHRGDASVRTTETSVYFYDLHGAISRKAAIFVLAVVRT